MNSFHHRTCALASLAMLAVALPLYSQGVARGVARGEARGEMTGTAEALAAASRLIERIGGADLWRGARSLYVRERAFHIRLGGPITAEFWRDLERPAFHSRQSGPGFARAEAWDAERGWSERDGKVTEIGRDVRVREIAGWHQEPYRVYRLLAIRDPSIQVSMSDGNRLVVAYADGRTLCWFVLGADGAPVKWGNVFDGRINEHTYGPLVPFGNFRMPKWGTSADGAWRFEYEAVEARSDPYVIPRAPTPSTIR